MSQQVIQHGLIQQYFKIKNKIKDHFVVLKHKSLI